MCIRVRNAFLRVRKKFIVLAVFLFSVATALISYSCVRFFVFSCKYISGKKKKHTH